MSSVPLLERSSRNLSTRGAGRARCCAPSAGEGEPPFLADVRRAAPAVLAQRSLAIAELDWDGARLCIYVSTKADVDGEPDAVGATVDECEFASRALGDLLDEEDLIPVEAYTLEVSTPGTSAALTKDREFSAFKGFNVTVRTSEVFRKKVEFEGTLHDRTKDAVRLNIKGRILAIPRDIVTEVKLDTAKEEQ